MHGRRRTWTIGGVALIACGVVDVLRIALLGPPVTMTVLAFVGDVLWGAGVLILAFGLRREASVVARRPLGFVASAVVALWPLAGTIADLVAMPRNPADVAGGNGVWNELWLLIPFAAGLVAAVEVLRARVVPRPWNQAPLWVLALRTLVGLLPLLIGITDPYALIELSGFVSALGILASLAATLGFGILALILAARPTTATVPVFRGDPAD